MGKEICINIWFRSITVPTCVDTFEYIDILLHTRTYISFVFFLEYAKGLRIFVLSRSKFFTKAPWRWRRRFDRWYKNNALLTTRHANYSRTKQPKFRAPASIQRSPEILMVNKADCGRGAPKAAHIAFFPYLPSYQDE